MDILLFPLWILFAFGTAIVAKAKGRSFVGWGCLGFIFGLFALLIVAVLPSRDTQDQRAARTYGTAVGQWRVCPACAEAVRVTAMKCRYCQSPV